MPRKDFPRSKNLDPIFSTPVAPTGENTPVSVSAPIRSKTSPGLLVSAIKVPYPEPSKDVPSIAVVLPGYLK